MSAATETAIPATVGAPDAVERALAREAALLEKKIAAVKAKYEDCPLRDRLNLYLAIDQYMASHTNESTKTLVAKLDEFRKQSDKIEQRIKLKGKVDTIALMDQEFALSRELDLVRSHAAHYAYFNKKRRA